LKKISQENLNLSQFVGKVFGDDWGMAEYLDAQRQNVIYVLSGRDKKKPGLVSHATIGLSDFKLGEDKGGVALGAELVGGWRWQIVPTSSCITTGCANRDRFLPMCLKSMTLPRR